MTGGSVLIATYNRAAYLDYTLAGFCAQTNREFELVIVDDGSNDDTRQIIQGYESRLNVKYLYQENTGVSGARNAGLEVCKGRFVIITDSDRIPGPSFVEEHARFLEENPSLVSIGRKHLILTLFRDSLNIKYTDVIRILRENPHIRQEVINGNTVRMFDPNSVTENFADKMRKCYLREPRDNYQSVVQKYSPRLNEFQLGWALATTGNVAFAKTKLRFDEKFEGWGLEDTEFFYRLSKLGYGFAYNRAAENFHQLHPRGTNEQKELQNNFNYFITKHKEPEVLLFVAVFRGELSLETANSILLDIHNQPNGALSKDYVRLLEAQWADGAGKDTMK
jgi:glycosyltransferase involved in cell wall biosynthesis